MLQLGKDGVAALEATHGSVQQYLTTMARDKEWGDGPMLEAASKFYKRQISVENDDGSRFAIGESTSSDSSLNGTINLHFSADSSHYKSVRLPRESRQTEAERLLPLGPPLEDAEHLEETERKNDDQSEVLCASTVVHSLPSCWSKDQLDYFKKDNPWICVNSNNGGLYCSTCRLVKTISVHTLITAGIRSSLSDEWIEGSVKPSGDTKAKQLKSLRKKVYEHRDSISHKKAEDLKNIQSDNVLKESFCHQQQEMYATTTRIFRTAYHVAQNNRPYTDHPLLLDLQATNGLDIGRVLHSNVSCTDIIDHIAAEMRRKLVADIVVNRPKISVLVDESTTLSRKSCLVVYVRCCLGKSVGVEPITFFLDIVELPGLTANVIIDSLMKCLEEHGLSKEILSECLLGFGFDGASVMLGRKNGVYAGLKSMFPHLIGWHCCNHRLELAVHDAVKSCTEINHFKNFMDKLYSVFSMSPKHQRNLEVCAAELSVSLKRIGRVLDVRWVASSYRTVHAVWSSYPALVKYFTNCSIDASLDSKERATFLGISKKLSSVAFVMNMSTMLDALEELSEVSLRLQAADITLPRALRLITQVIEIFQGRRDNGGQFYREVLPCIASGKFRGVPVFQNCKEISINQGQFYQALVDSLNARLLDESTSVISSDMKVLYPLNWPWPSEMNLDFGEIEVKKTCQLLRVDFSKSKQGFRDFKDSNGEIIPSDLRALMNAIGTLPVSTAACERGFSSMNVICTSLRSTLNVSHISSLIFISTVGPPLQQWSPDFYVKSWIAKGRKDANDLFCKARKVKKESTGMAHVWDIL